MSLIDEFSTHLPFLRRYARALTGDQAAGDAHVRAALEAAASDEIGWDASAPPRVALYQIFHALWASGSANLEPAAPPADGPDARLQNVGPRSREALLLTAMEGFTVEEAARILDLDEEATRALIARAHEEIESDLKTEVLVIEDEPIIAADLENIVGDLGHDVVAIARTRDEAVSAARDLEPGLVLADIQLADDSSGIDAANAILEEMSVPVIFITAFPERLLTGDRPEPAFLITKPFLPDAVKAAVAQALFFDDSSRPPGEDGQAADARV
ncbi:response regulator [Marinicauda salina]|uniref:Response regulator n=1 Tax=Marinicauda salina TaxID=2135793 RepID=A0A2U2BXR2_9PROT|nr:response regulator [Marinicauda salina]PWE18813.1 response regulator [Marinicauda salina]